MYSILIEDDFGLSRDDVMRGLNERGIDTRSFFVPMHRQEGLIAYGIDTGGAYPNSEYVSARGLYLPSGSGLTEQQIDRVCQAVLELRR
jgi:perosamine synthetase